MKKVSLSPDEYIDSLPGKVGQDISLLDKEISSIMSDQPKVLWQGTFWGGSEQNIIGYGDVTYKRPKGDIEWFIIGLAAQKNYISLYINAVEEKQYLAEKYADKLGKVKAGKSSIGFKEVEDIDMPVLLELVQKSKLLMTS